MSPELRKMFEEVTKGALSGKAGGPPKEDWKVNGEYVDMPDKGVVGIPFLNSYVEKAGIEFLEQAAKSDAPFFIDVNFMKMHQPNLPAPEFEHKSLSKTKYADSMVELDTRVGNLLNKLDELGLSENTVVFFTTDNGAWQDVYPDAGYTPFRGTKGTVREGGNRVPAFVRWPGKVAPHSKSDDILGGLDLMATFASIAGVELPKNDREGQPIIFDSYDMSPVWLGTGTSERKDWFYFTENELSPGGRRGCLAWQRHRGSGTRQPARLINHLNGAQVLTPPTPQLRDQLPDYQELSEIKGQETAKRALEIAAAGGHNLLTL